MPTHPARTLEPTGLPSLGDTQRSLRDQVADLIRERIVSGEFPPGTRLVERTLADSLGLSRVPVRDALTLLTGEGFVTKEPRRGVVVARMSRTDIEELFDVRSALEVLAVRLASQRATKAEIRQLRNIIEESAAALRNQDADSLRASNQAFHDALTAMAHHALLASTLQPLSGRLGWVLRQNDEPLQIHHDHEGLCRAIASGDADEAGRIALAHVRTSRELCLRVAYPDAHAPTASQGGGDGARRTPAP